MPARTDLASRSLPIELTKLGRSMNRTSGASSSSSSSSVGQRRSNAARNRLTWATFLAAGSSIIASGRYLVHAGQIVDAVMSAFANNS